MVFVCHVILQDSITKFGGHRHCGIGDIMVLVCQVISQDHAGLILENKGMRAINPKKGNKGQ